MSTKEKVTRIGMVLKRRFPNLTVEEVLELAFDILAAVEGIQA